KNPTQRWQHASGLRNALAALAAQPDLRATHLDVPKWIEWALAQPAQSRAWDDPAVGDDDPSVLIQVEAAPATQVGAAPVPPRGVGGGIPGLIPLRADLGGTAVTAAARGPAVRPPEPTRPAGGGQAGAGAPPR